eukprot:scaffold11940_cov106-Isochrysis_galbana.AAC.3
MMTDPPTDDTEAREPDAPDPTDAKHHAPLHGHTGGVPSDKALSDTRGAFLPLSPYGILLPFAISNKRRRPQSIRERYRVGAIH